MDIIKNKQRCINYIFILLMFCSVFFCSGEGLCDEDYYNSMYGNGAGQQLQSSGENNVDKKVILSAYSGGIDQTSAISNNSNGNEIETTVIGLAQANTDIADKADIIYSMGASMGQAVYLLLSPQGGGHSVLEVAEALINAGYSESSVNSYLIQGAQTKTLLNSETHVIEKAQTATGTATVYQNNPNDSETVQVNLSNLFGDGTLRGTNCTIIDDEGVLESSPDNQFNFSKGSNEFTATNAYYYTTKMQDFFAEKGIEPINVTVHINAKNGGANIETKEIGLQGYGQEDFQATAHEYVHQVTASIVGTYGGSGSGSEGEIIDEALATYLPASVVGDPKFNKYMRTQAGEQDKIKDISGFHVYTPGDTSLDTAGHPNGVGTGIMAMASALWEMREEFGKETADSVIVGSLEHIDSWSFSSVIKAMVKADQKLNSGANGAKIVDIMAKHGFV